MKRVVIIGAGPAGLTAAYELLSKSQEYEVVILEETQSIGGISRTVKHNGNRMDIGGHRFFSKDERVNQWWNMMMPMNGELAYDDKKLGRTVTLEEGGPDPETHDCVMLTRNRISRIFYKEKFFDYPIKMNFTTIKNMGFITTVAAGFSYIKAMIMKKTEDSLENFYINRFGKKLYSMFFEGYTEKLWGRHPREISADWGAQRVKGLSVVAIIKDFFIKLFGVRDAKVETSLIEEFKYPKYGPGQLWENVAEKIENLGGKILLSSKVCGVETDQNMVKKVTFANGFGGSREECLDADILISSMPIKDLVNSMNDVDREVSRIANGLPYRDFVTIGILTDRLLLKNQTDIKTLGDIVPDCWIYVQDVGVKLGRIQIFNNWSPYMVEKPEEKIWIGLEYFCTEGDKYWTMSDGEWVDYALSELVKMGVLDSKQKIDDSHVERVKKAYPAYFDTYEEIDKVISYLDRFGNLYCVGRNGQHRYNNMDHSMVTAFEAVSHILNGGASSKKAIWNVNTEQEYHETKS